MLSDKTQCMTNSEVPPKEVQHVQFKHIATQVGVCVAHAHTLDPTNELQSHTVQMQTGNLAIQSA